MADFNCDGDKIFNQLDWIQYISDVEREKCRNVRDAQEEFYEVEDIVVIDAKRYGFVKLLYYSEMNGFETVETYTDSRRLFDDLWSDWLDYQLFEIVSDTLMDRLDNEEIVDFMPEIIQEEIRQKYAYFAEKSGIFLS